jgi:hypothetical protein
MRRLTTVGSVVAALTLAGAGGASAQVWGWGDTPRSGVCFYEDVNFEGQYFCTNNGGSTANVPFGTNDRISSIRIFGDAAVTVYGDSNFGGPSRTFASSVPDLRRSGFNDRISSFRTDQRGAGNWDRNGNWGNGSWGEERQRDGSWNNQGYNGRRGYRQAESMVRRAYRSVLNRDPDPSGLHSWTQNVVDYNWSEQDLINALRQSDEYRETHTRPSR